MKNLIWMGHSFYRIPTKYMADFQFSSINLEYLLSINKKPENAVFHLCKLKCIHKCNTCLGLDDFGEKLSQYETGEVIEIHATDFIDNKK